MLLRASADVRRRDYQALIGSAARLGLSNVAEAVNSAVAAPPTSPPPQPQFVARETALSKLRKVLESTHGGVLVADDGRMPSLAGWGVNFNNKTADMLNKIAAGRGVELADPNDTCVRLRRNVSASVIGQLSLVDIYNLHKAEPSAIAATMIVCADFVAAAVPAGGNDARRDSLRGAEDQRQRPWWAQALRLSGPAELLDQARAGFVRRAASCAHPVAGYYKSAADLALRIAGVLTVADAASRGADNFAVEIGQDVAGRAVAFVERCALPCAHHVLGYTSIDPVLNNARRVASFVQKTSTVGALISQRDIGRLLRHSMDPTELEAAIVRLVSAGLLEVDPKVSGRMFKVSSTVFKPGYRLPDLVSDQRRIKD